MKRLTAILVALALCGPAHAVTITNDPGGILQDYAKRWQAYYQAREEVRIMGYCASACTLFLTLPNVCVGRNVQFAFHAPYIEQRYNADVDFQTEYAKAWTMNRYPGWVQDFIMAAGGLSKRTLHMGYAIAGKHMRTCGKPGGKRVQTALPMPVGPKLVPIPRQKPLIVQPKHDFSAAERRRQAEARDLYLRQMNARELVQHLHRAAAWTLQDQRAKELAARQVVEDAQARIEELLRASSNATLVILPTAVQEPSLSQEFQQERPRIRKRQNFNHAGYPRTKARSR
jgi:hypothetical protein